MKITTLTKVDDINPYTKVTARDRTVTMVNNIPRSSTADKVIADYDEKLARQKRLSKATKMLMRTYLPLPDNVTLDQQQSWAAQNSSGFDIATGKVAQKWLENGLDATEAVRAYMEHGSDKWHLVNSLQSVIDVDFLDRASQHGFGLAFNQYKEMIYGGPEFRTFTFSWTLVPKSQDHAKKILGLVDSFNYYSAPDTLSSAYSPYILPATFDIEFVNTKIPKLKGLVVAGVTANLGASGQMKLFRDGRPAHVQLSVNFIELDRPLKKTMEFLEEKPQ